MTQSYERSTFITRRYSTNSILTSPLPTSHPPPPSTLYYTQLINTTFYTSPLHHTSIQTLISTPQTQMSAQEFKDLGNKAFQAGRYEEAIEHYSNAIALEENHVFFSNRSGAYLALNQLDLALEDADQCIQIQPSFTKGYTRRGAALEAKKHWKDAAAAYEQALKYEPTNAGYRDQMQKCLQQDAAASQPPQPPGGFSLVPPNWFERLSANPQTKAMAESPSIRAALDEISKNAMALGKYQSNPAVIACVQALLGITPEMQQQMAQEERDGEDKRKQAEEDRATRPYASPSMARDTTSVSDLQKNAEEEEVVEVDEELEREKAERRELRVKADKIKEEGAVFYKARDFENALAKFKEAAEVDDTNPVYFMNVAAVQFELQKYEDCVATCKDALAVYPITAQQKGKTYARMANAHWKLLQHESAVNMFKKSILEDNQHTSRQALRQLESEWRQYKIESYFDEAKSEEAKDDGNKAYLAGEFGKAIEFYTDAIKRNPKNYKVYSNRAQCYIKIAQWDKGLEDCDKCLSFDPKFVKALLRKGKILHFLKSYHKAMTCYEEALKIEPNNHEVMEALGSTQRAIYSTHDSTPGGDEARLAEAMKDPELQMAMSNPQVQRLLQDMQTDPDVAMKAFQDPATAPLIQKLVAAGIIKMG